MAKKLTNGPQHIEESASDSEFFGGNSSDLISITGNNNALFGENGADFLEVFGSGNGLFGGNGADILSAFTAQLSPPSNNVLDGGNGSDTFYTQGFFGSAVFGTGAEITGGAGMDQFHLRQNSDIMVNNSEFGDLVVEEGHIIQGVFDVITDYSAGELIDVGVTTEHTGDVSFGGINVPGHAHIVLGDDEYAFIHGDLTADGQFLVNDAGGDLLLVYDNDPAEEYYFEYNGAVVLVGVTDTSSVNIGTLLV